MVGWRPKVYNQLSPLNSNRFFSWFFPILHFVGFFSNNEGLALTFWGKNVLAFFPAGFWNTGGPFETHRGQSWGLGMRRRKKPKPFFHVWSGVTQHAVHMHRTRTSKSIAIDAWLWISQATLSLTSAVEPVIFTNWGVVNFVTFQNTPSSLTRTGNCIVLQNFLMIMVANAKWIPEGQLPSRKPGIYIHQLNLSFSQTRVLNILTLLCALWQELALALGLHCNHDCKTNFRGKSCPCESIMNFAATNQLFFWQRMLWHFSAHVYIFKSSNDKKFNDCKRNSPGLTSCLWKRQDEIYLCSMQLTSHLHRLNILTLHCVKTALTRSARVEWAMIAKRIPEVQAVPCESAMNIAAGNRRTGGQLMLLWGWHFSGPEMTPEWREKHPRWPLGRGRGDRSPPLFTIPSVHLSSGFRKNGQNFPQTPLFVFSFQTKHVRFCCYAFWHKLSNTAWKNTQRYRNPRSEITLRETDCPSKRKQKREHTPKCGCHAARRLLQPLLSTAGHFCRKSFHSPSPQILIAQTTKKMPKQPSI